MDQIRLKLAQYKEGGCEFGAICLQETWLSEDSDKSLLCIEDYALISRENVFYTGRSHNLSQGESEI